MHGVLIKENRNLISFHTRQIKIVYFVARLILALKKNVPKFVRLIWLNSTDTFWFLRVYLAFLGIDSISPGITMAILVPKQYVERLVISTLFSFVLDTKMATSSGEWKQATNDNCCGASPYKRLNANCCKDAFLTTKYFLPVVGFLEVCLLHICISLCTTIDQVRERVQTSASGAPIPINQVPTVPIFYRFHF